MESRRLLICIAAIVAAMAAPVARAAGANGAHHDPVKLGEFNEHEGLLAAMQRGGCHYVFNWLPVVMVSNGIRESKRSSLRKGTPITLPDGCEDKPNRRLVREMKTSLFLQVKGQEAIVNEGRHNNLQETIDGLEKEKAEVVIPSLVAAGKHSYELTLQMRRLREQLAAARTADWRNVVYGGIGGMLLFGAGGMLWFRRLKKDSDIVRRVWHIKDHDTGDIATFESTGMKTVGCGKCGAKDIEAVEANMRKHDKVVHARQRQRESAVPLVPPARAA